MYGEDVPVAAEVVNLRQFSAHAGKSELMRWLTGLPAPPRQTYLVHGEPAASAALKSAIESSFDGACRCPRTCSPSIWTVNTTPWSFAPLGARSAKINTPSLHWRHHASSPRDGHSPDIL